MDWELRHIRCLIAIAETGTLTDAGLALGLSQAQVSRTLRALEAAWGVVLVRRQAREAVLTEEGQAAVVRGRHLLEIAGRLDAQMSGQRSLRLGYAWAAAGRHTVALQRGWDREQPGIDLALVRVNGASAGLAEGLVDAALVRTAPDPRRYESVPVGAERRVAAFAADDPWASRSRVRMKDFAGRRLLVDTRAGTTNLQLWPAGAGPAGVLEVADIDGWLDALAAGRAVGISSEATAQQHRRQGVRYRVIADAPPLQVRLAWHRGEAVPGLEALCGLLRRLYGWSGYDA